MQGVERCPDQQVEQQQQCDLVKADGKAVGGQPPQRKQPQAACQVAPQAAQQAAGFGGARGQLRILRSRSIILSCAAILASSASAWA